MMSEQPGQVGMLYKLPQHTWSDDVTLPDLPRRCRACTKLLSEGGAIGETVRFEGWVLVF
jgi:hypothetical protein